MHYIPFSHFHVVLQFSTDFRFIRQGVVIKRWKRYNNTSCSTPPPLSSTRSPHFSSLSSTTATTYSLYDFWRDFPLDGKWIVTSCSSSTTCPTLPVTGTIRHRRPFFENGQELVVTGGQCFVNSNQNNINEGNDVDVDHESDECTVCCLVKTNMTAEKAHMVNNNNKNYTNDDNSYNDGHNSDHDEGDDDQQWKHCRPVLLLVGHEPSLDANTMNDDDSLMTTPFFPITALSSSSMTTTTTTTTMQLWAKDVVDLTLPKLPVQHQQQQNSPSSSSSLSCSFMSTTGATTWTDKVVNGGQGTAASPQASSSSTWTHNDKANIQQHLQPPQHFGIPVGGTLEWTHTQPPSSSSSSSLNHAMDPDIVMTWKRISIAMAPPPDEVEYFGGNSGRHIVRLSPLLATSGNDSNGAAVAVVENTPTYYANSLWGNVFCQGLKVGLASYHFIDGGRSDDINGNNDDSDRDNHVQHRRGPRAYISYEHPATGQWPPLDNGAAVPPRVDFRKITMPNAHTFCASICWLEDFGTSWQGMVQWDYEMHFDAQYTCIISGHVHAYSQQNPYAAQEFSRYGESLVYTNAALYEVFRNSSSDLTRTTHSTSNVTNDLLVSSQDASLSTANTTITTSETTADNYRRASLDLRLRLQREGASVRTIALVHSILTAALNPLGENPVDYNLLY
jgi:hypothetical protein